MSSIWSREGTLGSGDRQAANLAPKPGNGAANRFAAMVPGGTGAGKSGATAGIPTKAGQAALAGKARANAASADSSSSTDDTGATITANDFLTLLVTEMQNQDPTADVDPNEYIDQLVQVNSLEQLISINQNLQTVLGTATSSSAAGQAAPAKAGTPVSGAQAAHPAASGKGSVAGKAGHATSGVNGNLSAPQASAASRTVARSLDGHARPGSGGHALRDIPSQALPR